LKTESKGAASLGNLMAGALLTADATGSMTVTSARGTELDMSAGTGLTAGTLTSTTGKIDVDTTAGLLKITSATAKTDLTAQAVSGALNVGTFTAATALLKSGTDMALTTGTTTGILKTESKGAASLGNLMAGALLTADVTGSMTVTSAKGTVLDMSAGTGLAAGTLTSTTGKIGVDSAAGLLKITTATAQTDLTAQAVGGALNVGTFTAATAVLKSGADMTLTTGTTAGVLTTDSKGAASLGNLTAGGQLTADATGAMTVTSAKGTVLDMSAGTGLTAGTLTSTTGKIGVDSAAGLLKITTATAQTLLDAKSVAGDLNIGTFTAATAVVQSGNDLAVTTANTSGDMQATAERNAALGTLTSAAGKVKVDSTGSMNVTSVKAANEVDLSGRTGLKAGTLTSTNAFIDVDSLTGSVSINSATAKTYFSANSYGAMTVGTFGVTAGYASLVSGGAMAITTGTSTGNMTIDGGTNVALGNLTTSGGYIDALARTGGITFGTLKANSKVKLRATSAWSNGQAISGTAMYASNGSVDLLANSGGILMTTLSGTKQSTVTTLAGPIKISTVLGFSPTSLLTVTATGGTKTVPVAYR
jgi:filamentous hemagglutinin